jgi:hypothetical protein
MKIAGFEVIPLSPRVIAHREVNGSGGRGSGLMIHHNSGDGIRIWHLDPRVSGFEQARDEGRAADRCREPEAVRRDRRTRNE